MSLLVRVFMNRESEFGRESSDINDTSDHQGRKPSHGVPVGAQKKLDDPKESSNAHIKTIKHTKIQKERLGNGASSESLTKEKRRKRDVNTNGVQIAQREHSNNSKDNIIITNMSNNNNKNIITETPPNQDQLYPMLGARTSTAHQLEIASRCQLDQVETFQLYQKRSNKCDHNIHPMIHAHQDVQYIFIHFTNFATISIEF